MVKNYANWLMRWRWPIIIGLVIFTAILASGGRLLKFDNDYRVFFDGDNPQLTAFENLQSTYTKNDSAVMLIAPKDGNVFSRATLAAIIDITERAWQTPYSIRVDSLSNFQHSYAEEDDLTVIDLIEDAQNLTDEQINAIRQVALNDPLLLNRLISSRGHVTAINITLELPEKDLTKENPLAVKKIRELADYARTTYPNIDVYLSGIVMLNAAFPEASKYDFTHLIPLATLVILIIVFIKLRNITGTLVSMVVMLMSVLGAMGAAGWLSIHLSPPVMTAPIIILTIAIADCVHILANWKQEMLKGKDKIDAMKESIRINFSPIFLTSLTTAIGFLTMNFSDAPPFHDLGNISAMGVVLAWLFSISFLPILVTLLPTRIKAQEKTKTVIMTQFSHWVIEHQKHLLIGIGSFIIILISFIPKNELNDVFVHYFDERIAFRTDTDFVVKNLTGVYFIDFSLDSKKDNDVTSPHFLNQVEQFAQWLRQQPEVTHVNVFTDIMKRLNKNMHGDDPEAYHLPDKRDLAAQYLLLYEMSLPYGLDLNNQVDINKRATRLFVTMTTLSTKEILAIEERIQNWMHKNTPEIQSVGSSPTIMFAHIGDKNIKSMLLGAVVAFLIISIILMIAFQSWRYGLLSLAPNVVPAAMAFGLWGIVDGEVGLSLSVVAAMTMGIVVDDTVHFLSKYRRAIIEQSASSREAITYAFETVGTAIWVTSAALIAGFMVISTSAFELNSGMGLLVSIVIVFALITDFLFLPPLLMKLDQWLHPTKRF